MIEFAIVKKSLPILIVVFVAVLLTISLLRLLLQFFLGLTYQNLTKSSKKRFPKSNKKFLKEDDELLRGGRRDVPKSHSERKAAARKKQANQTQESGTYEIIPSQEQELDRLEMNKVEIVDIVKPIGFWTSMILGQKLTYLIQSAKIINNRKDKGFWASMIEAKEREAGRQHSRGR